MCIRDSTYTPARLYAHTPAPNTSTRPTPTGTTQGRPNSPVSAILTVRAKYRGRGLATCSPEGFCTPSPWAFPAASTVRNRQRLQPFPYWLPFCPVRPPIPRDNRQHLHGNKRPQNAPFPHRQQEPFRPFYRVLLIPEIRLFTVSRNSTFPVR